MLVTRTMWNRHKGTPQPEIMQKPVDFIPSDMETSPQKIPFTSASKTLFEKSQKETGEEILYGSPDRLTFTVIRFILSD